MIEQKLSEWLESIYIGKGHNIEFSKEELTEENKKKVEDLRQYLEETLEDGAYTIGADNLPSDSNTRKVVMQTGKGGKIEFECMVLEELLRGQQRFLTESTESNIVVTVVKNPNKEC